MPNAQTTASGPADTGSQPLFEDAPSIYPRDVKGTFRRLKWWALIVLLGIYYVVPWIRWDRGPEAPDQMFLLDLAGRRGYIGGIEIWPQEVYYLTGILILAAVGLFFASALLGRIWCGFACFQTVWTDLYIWVERRIEGDRNKRIKLDNAPWTASKVVKKLTKHAIWLIIALMTAGYLVLYFVDAPTAVVQMATGRSGAWTYSMLALLTFTTYMAAGWAREQICIYMCPYPRFQSAMFDEDTLLVTYEEWRGEPRANYKKTDDFNARGHCVDCGLCVQVCPTGVDIRDGNQLACIGCALCIDACNNVMDRFDLPRGLITYDSERNKSLRSRGLPTRTRWIRPRTIAYVVVLALVSAVMVGAFAGRARLEVNILRDRAPLFVTLSSGDIRNGYTFKVLNMVTSDKNYVLSMEGLETARMTVIGYQDRPSGSARLPVEADSVGTFKVYVAAARADLDGESTDLTFVLTDVATGERLAHDTVFRGPAR